MSASLARSASGALDVERAAALIRECKEIEPLVDLRDQARAIELYTRRRRAGLDAQIDASEIAIRAERRLGEIVRELPKSKGGRTPETGSRVEPVPKLADLGISKKESHRWQKLAEVPEEVFTAHVQHVRAVGEKLTTKGSIAATSAGAEYDSDEWYTPSKYVEAARQVMGGIDLDPASCEVANQTVGAKTFYTKAQDGLSPDLPWRGRVWLNPPFSQPAAGRFAQRLLEDFAAKRVRQAVFLQNAATDTAWFHALASRGAVCFPRRRLAFLQADGRAVDSNRSAQVLIYLGDRTAEFDSVFTEFGLVGALRGAG